MTFFAANATINSHKIGHHNCLSMIASNTKMTVSFSAHAVDNADEFEVISVVNKLAVTLDHDIAEKLQKEATKQRSRTCLT